VGVRGVPETCEEIVQAIYIFGGGDVVRTDHTGESMRQHVEQRRQAYDVLRGLGRHVADVRQLAARSQRLLDPVVRPHPRGVCRR
jgi:hypothetical protein